MSIINIYIYKYLYGGKNQSALATSRKEGSTQEFRHLLSFRARHFAEMISQLFILSLRGDIIINRDFRSELIKTTPEIFYRNVKLYKGDAPPLFNIEGINFAYIKKQGLYVVCTSRFDGCPSVQLEILNRFCKMIKDFCGIMNEEAIRKNFVLIYEILDEVVDFGYP